MGATHGKKAAVYLLRPNGHDGSGLNDLSWGAFSGATASSYFEVEILAEAVPDTFRWRENGGAWDDNGGAGYAITGAEQTLSGTNGDQKLTFAATTGHASGDAWTIANLKNEACTESSEEAQITDTAKRLLNPNATITFADTGGALVDQIIHLLGKAVFNDSVTTVTVTGTNGYIRSTMLEKVGYLFEWTLDFALETAEVSAFQEDWKDHIAGLGEFSGSAQGYFVGSRWFEILENMADGTQPLYLIQLFSYDPDDDQTGDHYNAWVSFPGLSLTAGLGGAVSEEISFQGSGTPVFVANT